jgi:hypothetical protein
MADPDRARGYFEARAKALLARAEDPAAQAALVERQERGAGQRAPISTAASITTTRTTNQEGQ